MKTKKLVCYNCGGHGFITTICESGQTSTICPICGGIGTHEIQMTNADRIRAMSDEELAEFIKHVKVRAAFCKAVKDNDAFEKLCSAEWLQQPAEEDKHD